LNFDLRKTVLIAAFQLLPTIFQKAVQLLREGKLALNENADARTLPGKAITTAEIAKF
jgi:hypothetical protein